MPKFPEPPSVDTLAAIPPELIVVPAATELWRAYSRGGPHPTLWNTMRTFGPAAGRFDHQLPPPRVQARSVVYLAISGLLLTVFTLLFAVLYPKFRQIA